MNSDDSCFCDLAPLYALDLLTEEERRMVETELAQYPELQEELDALEETIAALGHSAPPVEMAPDLKDRLFQRLELNPPDATPSIAPTAFGIKFEELDWQPHPVPGVSIAVLHSDPVKREVVGFLRAEAGCHYPLHRHAGLEEILMLEGDLVIPQSVGGTIVQTVYGAGDYIRSSPGSSHAPITPGGCMFFFRTSMDDEYLESIVE